MNLKAFSLGLSNVLVLTAYIVYILSIFRKQSRPHRTTRFVLLIITGLATLSLIAQHNQVAVWLAGISTIMSAFVFVLSIPYGMGGWAKIDVVCLVIALLGILMWRLTNNPILALFSAILADFTGIFPTLMKAYHHPKTEVWTFFALGGLGALLNLFAINSWVLEEYAYPLYLVFINITLVALLIRKKIKKERYTGLSMFKF